MKTTTAKTLSLSSILFAVAVLATGCHKAENTTPATTDTATMGPAQSAGKAVDDAGAKAAAETREAAADANAAANRAGEKIDAATDRAAAKVDAAADRTAANMKEAGAEVRQESKEAAANVKEGAKDATAATGRALERTGEKMQQNAGK
jgi:colicin import membrane protein